MQRSPRGEGERRTTGEMREPQHYDLVIIGTGPAGRRAAIQAAKAGKRVVAIDRQRYIGGQAVHRGTIPSKTLREAVIHVTGVGQRSFYGAAYRVMTNVTMDDLLRRTAQVVQSEVDVVRDGFLRNDVEMLNGIAHFEDPHTIAVHTENSILEISADKVILATGSSPARPPHIPFDKERVVDSDGILDLHTIPKSMTIVGAGVIGTEYASIFATLGVAVTLIDGRKNLLEMVDEEIGEALKYRMREDGITLRLGPQRVQGGVRPSGANGYGPGNRGQGGRRRGDVFDWASGRHGPAEPGRGRAESRRAGAAEGEQVLPNRGGPRLRGGRRDRTAGAGLHFGGAGAAGGASRPGDGLSEH